MPRVVFAARGRPRLSVWERRGRFLAYMDFQTHPDASRQAARASPMSAGHAPLDDGVHRVQHIRGGQVVAGGQLGPAAGFAAALGFHQAAAGFPQLQTRRRVDGVVDAAVAGHETAQQLAVGSVDDGVCPQPGDIPLPERQPRVGRSGGQSVSLHHPDRARLKTGAAVQAVLLPDDRRLLGNVDAPLGAVGRTPLAADAGVGDAVALGLCLARADGVALAEDGADPQVEIFDVHIPDVENDADLSGIPRVDVGQVGLLRKDAVPPCGLLCVGHRFGCARQADHLFVHGVAQHLHLGGSQQLPAEVLAPAVKKYKASGS